MDIKEYFRLFLMQYTQFINVLKSKVENEMYLKREGRYFFSFMFFSFPLHSCLSHLPFLKSLSQRKMRLPLVTC